MFKRNIKRFIAAVIVIVVFWTNSISAYANENIEQRILSAVNAQRTKAGVSILSYSSLMEKSAVTRAMELEKVWSHTRPDGTEYWTVNSSLIYGENLYKGGADVDSIISAWMASPSHKDNILYGDFKTASVGVYQNNGVTYIALEFGY